LKVFPNPGDTNGLRGFHLWKKRQKNLKKLR